MPRWRYWVAIGLVLGAPIAFAAEGPPAPVPTGWLPEVQRALAAKEYEASRNEDGLQAPNRRHGLRSYFEPTGVRVHDRTAAGSPELLALRLSSLGRGARLAPVAAGELSSAGARVEIHRPGLVEWYVNSEAGLEQGFTLAERPVGEGPLVLELALTSARATLAGDHVLLASHSGRRLAYGKLAVMDARGTPMQARFEVSSPDRLRIVLDDAGALYPLTIDPLLTEAADAQLESNQASGDFGESVASAGDVNGDGYADVIVGASFYDSGENDEGAAFLFLGSASGIVGGNPSNAAAKLESNQADALFGNSVAAAGDVNGDGYGDVIVGAYRFNAGQSQEGAAFLFLGSASGIANGNPSTAAAQLESNQVDAVMGTAVASAGDVNGDGYSDVIVGAGAYQAGESAEGAAFVFLGSASGIASGNPSTAATQIESDQVDAYLGESVATAGDVNGDGYSDVIVGAYSYTAGQSNEGAAFVFLGSASGIASGDPTTAAAQLESNQADASFGYSVAAAGDVNGDGYADAIVGAYQYDAGESEEGAAFVFLGSVSGIASGNPSTAAAVLESDQASAELGTGVASAGDVNGDGYADIIVGARFYDAGQSNEGAAFVFLGSSSGIASANPATAAFQLESNQADANLGYRVAGAGDVNGDGYADLIVGATNYDAGQSNEGAAFVYLGGAQGIVSGNPSTAGTQLEANQAGGQMGSSVAGAGDVNGDGYADVIVGASGYDAGQAAEGAAFVFHGSAAGIANGSPATAAARLESDQGSARMGSTVAAAGDVNGDGYADVIVGAPSYDGQTAEGAAFVFLGSAAGIANASPATAAARLESDQVGASMAFSVAGAGDVNGDGYADVIVGAKDYNAGQSQEGAAFIFLGSSTGIANGSPATAAARLESDQASARMGVSVAGAGDVNGDGFSDVIVGAYLYDAGQSDEGAAFVFHGSVAGIANGAPASAATQLESDQIDARLGTDVASAGDVNGDGYADVIVGAFLYNDGESNEGAAFVFLGSASGIADGGPATAATQLESDQVGASMAVSVAGAGDVNGDGYADVIVGANSYNAGESSEGAAFVFLGSASGIADGSPATAAAQLESNQASVQMGVEVAGAGDVNGDGYADVIVGALYYNAGQLNEGAAFLFYGGGNRTGRPVLARQLRGGGGSQAVQPWGTSYDLDDFQVRARATDPRGRGRVKLQVQACPSGVPFGHVSCTSATSPSWTDVTATSAGVTLTQTLAGLAEGTLRRWRARVLYAPYSVTQSGITAPPNPAHGPWRRLFGQAFEADVRISHDTDDDDGDGLLDIHETDTGTYVSPTNTGTDPLDPDSDDDGILDGAEIPFGTNPNDPDHDDDGDLDGADNCPFIVNAAQTNSDALPAGNACQCGDVNNDGVVNATDVTRASESMVGRTLGGAFVPQRCNVVGPNDGGPTVCDVGDLGVLERFAQGQAVTVQNACQAYLTP